MNNFNRKSPSCCSQRSIPRRAQSPAEQFSDYASWLSAGRWLGRTAANDLSNSTHHSKTTAQSHYRKTIGLKQSAGAIVVR